MFHYSGGSGSNLCFLYHPLGGRPRKRFGVARYASPIDCLLRAGAIHVAPAVRDLHYGGDSAVRGGARQNGPTRAETSENQLFGK